MEKKILDVTCGARSIWFNKNHPAAVYCDKRREQYHHLWKNAGNCTLDINPDVVCDFTDLPFPDNSFPLVVFDPPHLTGAKETAWLARSTENWMRPGRRCSMTDFRSVCAYLNRMGCSFSNGQSTTSRQQKSGRLSGRSRCSDITAGNRAGLFGAAL